MATYTLDKLSASTSCKQIYVNGLSGSSGTIIHTAVGGTAAFDMVWLYATNNGSSNIPLTIMWGGTTNPNDYMQITIPYQSGRFLIVDGKMINSSLMIQAFAGTTNCICIDGYVNKIV